MKWTVWPRSASSRPRSEPTMPLPPYVGKQVMTMFMKVLAVHVHRARQERYRVLDIQRFTHKEGFAPAGTDESAKVTIARLVLALELLAGDSRFKLAAPGVEEL